MWENSKQVLEFTANCFNFELESKRSFRDQECHFSWLRSLNLDHRWVTRVSKGIYFFLWKQCTSCFMNILHFLWREAPQNVKVAKYENLGRLFMLIFKNRTAPDDPIKMATMLWYLARIIKSKMVERVHITRITSCLRRWIIGKTRKSADFVFYRYFNDVNAMYFSSHAIVQPSWK